jgi:microcystin-dependent protein
MACSNCYNGCTEIISDQCVKYTGVDVPVLGIQTGDSLSYVEQALIGFLTSTLDGTGIKLVIDPDIICEIINKNLVECEDLTLVNVINALIKAVCELDTRVTALEDDFAALEGPYTIGCLTGVTSTSGTHAILQATITKLCSVEVALNALALNVSTNYVKLADLNSLIAAYLASVGTTTKFYNRMVPYAVVEYYGPLVGNFDVSGAGLGDWEKIYLCNGNNGTPDKRGRVPVGATTGMGGGALNPAVDPAVAGNPAYALLGTAGSNTVTLSPTQIPAHSHSATATVVDNHYHFVAASDSTGSCDIITSTDPVARAGSCGTNPAYELRKSGETTATLGKSSGAQGTIDVSVAIGSTGGGLAHSNYQPGLGCYYIMYIP